MRAGVEVVATLGHITRIASKSAFWCSLLFKLIRTTHDYYGPITGRSGEDRHLLRAGRLFTLLWGIVLVLGTSSAPRRETRPHPENHDGTWRLTFREAALLGTADVIAP